MRALVTGASGFVGKALSQHLLSTGTLRGQPIAQLTLLDRHFDDRCPGEAEYLVGDMGDVRWLDQTLSAREFDVVFHLASIPGGMAEEDHESAVRVNLHATETLLEVARKGHRPDRLPPTWVFASSIAALGHAANPVTDDTLPRPVMSYGAHKLIGEILVSDYSRRGWVDGRSVRLPGVLARPPIRTGQLSAFLSDIIRELAAGRAYCCPTSPAATTWASSLPCVVEQLAHAAEIPIPANTLCRTWTLPTLRFTLAELVEAIGRVYDVPASALVSYQPNERIEALFGQCPELHTPAAEALGFRRDADLDTLVCRALDQANIKLMYA